ncbi:efflux RND transporter permease subunit [Synechococcus sp. CS-197]|uniref:efflux RND transporter permease subunit n=1 Tax=Synechococcus sp. CS-197 TaxID=2847985 RepID=UPI0001525CDD|nr:efflux RND transporter permease subunit [Synechococcus sp. CS-197]MCT0251472.1 efflux RND transporter permease subunit [Synechococcus sp. CS-197]CAK24592.1 Multidrug efflux transporter, Hydrophobe/Amphiphile Efflux-1 (HAE1) family (2.A.6.2.), RND superfamily [Synechococcus sp. WH 7803]
MSASNNFITRPVLTTVCSILIVIVGLIAIPILPIENLPDIAPPTVKVRATYTGADAVSVEEGVTTVLEQQINGVENMDFIKSNSSSDGVSAIDVAFASGTDGDINQVNVQNRVSLAEPQLPEEVRKAGVTVNKASNSILLVYNFGSANPEEILYSAETISGLLDLKLTDSIKRVTGVGDLTYFGNRKLAFRLWLDPSKLSTYGLTSTDVVNQLSSQNRLVPAGQVGGEPSPKGQEFTFTVQLQGRLRSVEEFENMIVRTADEGGLVRLRDVGSVQLGGESYAVSATDLQGVPSVGLAVYQLTGSNALEVSDGVKKVLAEFEKTMPIGMKMEKIYDNTDFITASIKGVVNSLRDAVILVVLILFLFLQNWKATLVPGIAIPVALIGTFGLVLAFGFSLNQLTLFGLVLATGLVVDDAITVIEDTSTKKSEGLSALEAAKSTMDELFSAIIATSLVKFAVFLPVLFFPGATGTIYKQFAATVIFSIAISTFNALTFSPMLSALLLARESKDPGRKVYAIAGTVIGFFYGLLVVGDGAALVMVPTLVGALVGLLLSRFLQRPAVLPFTVGGAIAGLVLVGVSRIVPVILYPALGLTLGWFTPVIFANFNRFYAVMEARYSSALNWALGSRRLVMGILGVGILLTAVAFRAIPGGFVPIEDQGYAIGVVQAPEGVSTQVTEAINQKVAAVLRTEKDITAASVFSGASLDGNSPNKGLFFFGTKNWSDRKERDQNVGAIVERLNQKLAASIDGARVIVVEPPAIPGYGTGGGFEFQLLDQSGGAYNLADLYATAGRLVQAGNADPDLNRVYTLFAPESPQIEIKVDRERMAAVDVDFGSAMQTFSVNFGGLYVNDTFQEGKVRRVYVQADAESRATPEKLSAIYVKDQSGEQIPLSEFFTVRETLGPTVVPHFNLYRAIKIEGTPAAGKSSGQAITAMKGTFETLNPQGLGFDWTGISREEVKAGALAVVIFALGILAVYLVLSAQYESYSDPLIILMTVPTAMLGALVFLALRGEVLNVYAQVGLVMLIGLAAGNGILIVDMANQRMQAGANALDAARFAAGSRLRPILMTAISSLFGFIPLVFASGAGARSQTSLGAVVFGGLLIATVLSLFVVPVFYVVMKSLLGEADGQSEAGASS